MSEPLKFVGGESTPINLTGYLFAWWTDTDQPLLINNGQDDDFLLPVFSTRTKLLGAMTWIKPDRGWKTKQIQDQHEFLDSVRGKAIVAVDPWINEAGNTRFTGVFIDSKDEEINHA